MSIDNIYHYERITDQIGCSGQPTSEQFEDIANAGFKSVINLAMADSDNAIPNEGSLVTALGMTYVQIPVDFANPTRGDLDKFCAVMQSLEADQVWVHCVVNARVSAFLYLYLRHIRNLDEPDCRTQLLDRWEPQMDDVWKNFMQDGDTWLQT
ncbi:MAG: protein tyrosine phosphatase family protein [Pseudomonadota bacterium]